MKHYNILVVKETKSGEQRVSIVPQDAEKLIKQGYTLFIEKDAGKAAGFEDADYVKVGCVIRDGGDDKGVFASDNDVIKIYKNLFKGVDVIIRAKRAEHEREALEVKAVTPQTIMIGALDPFESNSGHIEMYRKAGIIAYSIDQMQLNRKDPMNLLAAMSRIAGKLAFKDALQKLARSPKKAVIIGFGVVGQAALEEAISNNVATTIIATHFVDDLGNNNNEQVIMKKDLSLEEQQAIVLQQVKDADIIIASARVANQKAPILIPDTTLKVMKSGAVIVDMALSEGGNVSGAQHDKTLILGNNIVVTNTSGYPKVMPHESSIIWSRITREFVLKLLNGEKVNLEPC